jgi:acyl-CoA reductase-like NAD-dependent aldehyde dehydrogenase
MRLAYAVASSNAKAPGRLTGVCRLLRTRRHAGFGSWDSNFAEPAAGPEADVRLPWGGARDSGLGREHGDAAIDNFTEPKAIWLALA